MDDGDDEMDDGDRIMCADGDGGMYDGDEDDDEMGCADDGMDGGGDDVDDGDAAMEDG